MNPHAVTTDTLIEAMTDRAHDPDGVFCHFIQGGNTRSMTRGQLLSRAKTFASYYSDSGLKSGDLLIIILKHSRICSTLSLVRF
jgi:acyl-CoA synthetase (AMP-forming)/AMP-acid ligase II